MSLAISPNTVLKIRNLFIEKKWPTEEGNSTNPTLFNKFCERLKLFKSEHQELIIELTKKFIRISVNEYLQRFYESLLCLDDDIIYGDHRIFIYPMVNPYVIANESDKIQKGKTKSADFLHYMIEADDYTWVSRNITLSNSIELLRKEFNNENSYLILIDDFIGSGNTAITACKIFLEEKLSLGNIHPDRLKIVCLAAQKGGIENINETIGIEVASNIIMDRGISDNYAGAILAENITKMTDMEKTLRIAERYHFGFEKTEALITFMNKTPNNTFPIYWYETETKIAPFPRYKKYAT